MDKPLNETNPANFEERKHKLEWYKFIAGVSGGVIVAIVTCGMFFFHDRPDAKLQRRIDELEQEKREKELARDSAQIVKVAGGVGPLATRITLPRSQINADVAPISVTIQNAGATPVSIDRIECQIFTACSEEVCTFDLHTTTVGLLDMSSKNWKAVPTLKITKIPEFSVLRQEESRQVNFHLLNNVTLEGAYFEPGCEINKIIVTVHPADHQNWAPVVWCGFTDPMMCSPAPFDAGFESDSSNYREPYEVLKPQRAPSAFSAPASSVEIE